MTKLVTVEGGNTVVLPARVTVEVVPELDGSTSTVVHTAFVKVVVEVTVVSAKTVAAFTVDVTRDLTDAIALPAAPA